MKQAKIFTWVLIALYVVVFIIGGYFLYQRFFRSTLKKETEAIPIGRNSSQIFYAVGNNLYQLDPKTTNQQFSADPSFRTQSTGIPGQLVLDQDKTHFYYDSFSGTNQWEIWQVDLASNTNRKLYSTQIAGLESFKDFTEPKISSGQLFFLAQSSNTDAIFRVTQEPFELTNLTYGLTNGKINTFEVSADAKKVVFAAAGDKAIIYELDLAQKELKELWQGEGKVKKLALSQNGLYFQLDSTNNNQLTSNLMSLKPDKSLSNITNLNYPKTLLAWQMAADKNRFAYEIQDVEEASSDIYTSRIDGSNFLRLTNDGLSRNPVFSPSGNTIAYCVTGQGIFLAGVNGGKPEKLLNYTSKIDRILLWY